MSVYRAIERSTTFISNSITQYNAERAKADKNMLFFPGFLCHKVL